MSWRNLCPVCMREVPRWKAGRWCSRARKKQAEAGR